MYDIYATDFVYEQCARDKREIKMLFPYAVIHFVLSGEGYVNGEKIGKNTVFISAEENRMHYYPSRTNPWSYIYLRLRGSDLQKAFNDNEFKNGLTIRSFEDSEALFNLLSIYQKLSSDGNTEGQKIVANAVFLLFRKNAESSGNKSKSIERMEQIKRYIEENYYKNIKMEDIADKFYINKNYMRTLFMEKIGISPKQYLQKIRMERAKYLLSSSNESIKLIANSVGYGDSLLFSKMFKQYCGVSPKEYRVKK